VSRYGVDVEGFERLVLPVLSLAGEAHAYLIDEIGKMETFSARFVEAVGKLLDGEKPVVATIALHGGGVIRRIRNRTDATTITVTPSNRDALPADLFQQLVKKD
jgi:nucleoside-triphosphatase